MKPLRTLFSVLLMFCLSCSVLTAQKPDFKNSVWKNEQSMFVADAGTMTITNILEFGEGKDVKVGWQSYMPAHPAMYVNRDGSIDKIPAHSAEDFVEGTWQFKKDILTITLKDGSEKVFRFQSGQLVGDKDFDGSDMIYTRQ